MAKRLNVEIGFSAETGKVRKELSDLQNQLTALGGTKITFGENFDFDDAIRAADEFAAHLRKATNINTGQLDLSSLNQSLKQSNQTLSSYMNRLLAAGEAGQQAFMSVARAISQAEVPLKRTNAQLNQMWITLKNTARWQISATVLHSLTGGLGQAFRYARDLNASLNNIRIVTGQSTEQMKSFAEEANKAAKALNTTTTEYTDAALIYYQQGDAEELVRLKTDLTVQAANVAKTTTEQMSEYLTAVWNSYQVGADELGHFVDKMAAVGAATASSLQEISTAMTKVAATANIVGVNFDQLTSIAATVASVTRESPETIGTAYKTIFARIADLRLGETDEEGVSLGLISSQLEQYQIAILDADNQLRDMGTVIEEIGDKWATWDRGTQAAIAQVIAGRRQYTHLIALFDNWDKYYETLGVAQGARGTLDSQAEIYAESWEAARERVVASAENIYSALLNDEFFVDFNNTLANFLDSLSFVLDSIGGLGGAVTLLGSIFTQVFQRQISQSLSTFANNMTIAFGGAQKIYQQNQVNMQKMASSFADQGAATFRNPAFAMELKQIAAVSEMKRQLSINSKNMTEAQIQEAQALIALTEKRQNAALGIQANIDARELEMEAMRKAAQLRKIEDTAEEVARQRDPNFDTRTPVQQERTVRNISQELMRPKSPLREDLKEIQLLITQYKEKNVQIGIGTMLLKTLTENSEKWGKSFKAAMEQGRTEDLKKGLRQIITLMGQMGAESAEFEQQLEEAFVEGGGDAQKFVQLIESLFRRVDAQRESLYEQTIYTEDSIAGQLEEYGAYADPVINLGKAAEKTGEDIVNLNGAVDSAARVGKDFTDSLMPDPTIADGFAQLASSTMMVASGINAIQSLGNIWNNEDLTTGEKIVQTMFALSSGLPLVTGLMQLYAQSQILVNKVNLASGKSGFFSALAFATTGKAAGAAIPGVKGFAVAVNLALWPVTLIIAALGAAALAFSWLETSAEKESQAQKDNRDATIENTKARLEQKKANEETASEFSELVQQLKNANATEEESAQIRKQLYELSDQLITAYEIEGGAVDRLTGNYAALNEKMRERQRLQAQEALKLAEEQGELVAEKLRSNFGGRVVGSPEGGPDRYGITLRSGVSTMDEEAIDRMIKELLPQNMVSDDLITSGGRGLVSPGSLTIRSEDESLTGLLALYEELSKVKQKIEDDDTISEETKETSEYFQNLSAWLTANKEAYDQAAAIVQQINDLTLQDASLNNLKVHPDDITSLEQYLQYREQLINLIQEQGVNEEEAVKKAEEYLSTLTTISEYKLVGDSIKELGQEWDKSTDFLENYYKTLEKTGEEDLFKLFNFDLIRGQDLDIAQIQAHLNSQLQKMRLRAELGSIEISKETFDKVREVVKKGVGETGNLQILIDAGIQWGEEGAGGLIPTLAEFVSMTAEKQTAVIDKLDFQNQAQKINVLLQEQARIKEEATRLNLELEAANAKVSPTEEAFAEAAAISAQAFREYEEAARRAEEAMQVTQNSKTFFAREAAAANQEAAEKARDLAKEEYEIRAQITQSALEDRDGLEVYIQNLSREIGEEIPKQLQENELTLTASLQVKDEAVIMAIENIRNSWTENIGVMTSSVNTVFTAFETLAKGISEVTNQIDEQGNSLGNIITLSAEAVSAVADIYPQLLLGAEVYEDGSIRIADDIAAAYGHSKNEIVRAATESTISQLELDNTLLYAKRDSIIAELNAIYQAASIKQDYDAQLTTGAIENRNQLLQAAIGVINQEGAARALYLATQAGNEEEFHRIVTDYLEAQGFNAQQSADAAARAYSAWSQEGVTDINRMIAAANELNISIAGGMGRQQQVGTIDGIDTEGLTLKEVSAAFETGTFTAQGVTYDAATYIKELTADLSGINSAIANNMAQISRLREGIFNFEAGKYSPEGRGGRTAKEREREIRELVEVADKLHEINKLLEYQSHLLSMLSKEKNRVYGHDYIKLLERESQELKRQRELLKEKADGLGLLLALDAQAAEDIGAQFDDVGNIKNRTQVVKDLIAQMQIATNLYNNSEQEEADKEAYDAAKKLFDKRMEILNTYEEGFKELNSLREQEVDAFDAWQQTNLEKLVKKIEFRIEISDRDLRLLQYFQGKLGEDFFGSAEKLGFNSEFGKNAVEQMKFYDQMQQSATEMFEAGEINQAQYVEMLDKASDGILAQLQALNDLAEVMQNAYQDALKEAQTELGQYTDILSNLVDIMNSYADVYRLVFGEKAYEGLKKFYEAQVSMAMDTVETTKTVYDMYQDQFNMAVALFGADSPQALAARASMLAAQKEMLGAIQNYLTSVKQEYSNNINAITEHLEKRFLSVANTAASSISSLLREYDRWVEIQDRYLSTARRLHEVTMLSTTIEETLAETTNEAGRAKLLALQEELDLQRENQKLTQFDIDMLNAKYELTKALIAAEEQEDAKTQVRLARDDRGNFSYQFTRDRRQLENSRREYELALIRINDLALNRTRQLERQFLTAQEQYLENLRNIWLEEDLTFAQKQEQQLALEQRFLVEMEHLRVQHNISTKELAENNFQTIWYHTLKEIDSRRMFMDADLGNLTEEEYRTLVRKGLYETLTQAEQDNNLIRTQGYNTMVGSMIMDSENLRNVIIDAGNQMQASFQNYQNRIVEVERMTGISFKEMQSLIQQVTHASEDLSNFIGRSLIPQLNSQLSAIAQQVVAFQTWRTSVTSLISEFERLLRTMAALANAQTDVQNIDHDLVARLRADIARVRARKNDPETKAYFDRVWGGVDNYIAKQEERLTDALNPSGNIGSGNAGGSARGGNVSSNVSQTRNVDQGLVSRLQADIAKVEGLRNNPTAVAHYNQNWGGIDNYLRQQQNRLRNAQGFQTGGYTGDWAGQDGRLAVLHQKELVLNAQDTQNILAAVGTIRALDRGLIEFIGKMLSANASATMRMMGSGLQPTSAGGVRENTLQQNVRIEATFPGVTNSNEIENALKNLVNDAAQFISRKQL